MRVRLTLHPGRRGTKKDLRRSIKGAGGTWDPEKRAWHLPLCIVKQLGLEERILH